MSRAEQPNQILEQLRDPLRLRVAVCVASLLLGYFALYSPLDAKIQKASRQLDDVKKLSATLTDVSLLEEQDEVLVKRLGPKDPAVCVQHVVDTVRAQDVKVLRLEPAPEPVKIGSLEAASFQLDVEGPMKALDALLYSLETDEKLFRIESFRITPSRKENAKPQMHVKFLMLKEAS